ncbi:MAG: branched-chain amino acid ABC transporter permease [Spirochaetales bacterium]|nr:branched-chain amino acid ABC transporter permease [Spirochaetales bacterium]
MMFYLKVLEITLLYTILVLGIYLMTGLTGLFSLGQGAFVSLGAYTAAVTYLQLHTPCSISIILAVIVGLAGGIIVGIPTLRLRRDYFLLVTFGFSEMMRGLLLWAAQLTGGAMGIAGIPKLVGLPVIIISIVVILLIISNLKRTNFGRVCIAIRDDELAASINGINVYAHKMKVFVLSSMISAYGGALYAFNIMFIEPNLFSWLDSAKLIIIVFVGGINSLFGTFIMSMMYYTFGEFFRFVDLWKDVLLAILVIVIIIYRDKGLFGKWELSSFVTSIKKAIRKKKG